MKTTKIPAHWEGFTLNSGHVAVAAKTQGGIYDGCWQYAIGWPVHEGSLRLGDFRQSGSTEHPYAGEGKDWVKGPLDLSTLQLEACP